MGIAPDTVEQLGKMLTQIEADISDVRLLADSEATVIDRYGLRNEESSRNLPHPTTFVIDPDGVVRWRFTEVNYKIRPTNDDVLQALEDAGL